MTEQGKRDHECEHFLMTDVAVYACDCDNIQIIDVKDGHTTEYVPKERIKELEAAIPQLIMIIDQSGVDLLKSEIELIKSLKSKP